jgi:phosphohistidine phosphatase
MITFPEWIYRQSGALPFRLKKGKLEVLLISSRKGKRWVIPKGIVEPGMSGPASAAKEAAEEAGIDGRMSAHALGTYCRDKWGGTCEVEVFPMRVTREHVDWPESSIRKRQWLACEDAALQVRNKALEKIIKSLPEALDKPQVMADFDKGIVETPRKLLYLFRHAKSSWDNPSLDDFDRPLAPRGEAASKSMARYFELADVHPDLVLCSPSARTRATLANVRAALGSPGSVKFDDALYHAGSATLMDFLRAVPTDLGSVMVIGHNPGLESLAHRLVGDGDSDEIAKMRSKFPTAALAILVLPAGGWSEIGRGSCKLHSFVVPRDLE